MGQLYDLYESYGAAYVGLKVGGPRAEAVIYEGDMEPAPIHQ